MPLLNPHLKALLFFRPNAAGAEYGAIDLAGITQDATQIDPFPGFNAHVGGQFLENNNLMVAIAEKGDTRRYLKIDAIIPAYPRQYIKTGGDVAVGNPRGRR